MDLREEVLILIRELGEIIGKEEAATMIREMVRLNEKNRAVA